MKPTHKLIIKSHVFPQMNEKDRFIAPIFEEEKESIEAGLEQLMSDGFKSLGLTHEDVEIVPI